MHALISKPNSAITWRQIPQGNVNSLAFDVTTIVEIFFSPDVIAFAIALRSAQIPAGYDAFSIFT